VTDLKISLTVTAIDPHPPSAPGYTSTSTKITWIHIEPPQQLTKIDVLTNRGGKGANITSEAYGPQELIRMYAIVTCRDTPVANRDVLFTVRSPNGSIVATRLGETNQTGVAYSEYRLPTTDASFGVWSITASVNVSQATISDTVKFAFNYLGSIENVQLPSSVKRAETLPIDITVHIAGKSTTWTRLDITVFDSAKVPIGSFTVANTQPDQTNMVIHASMPIPSWAFTGQATAYICLFTISPEGKSVPLCPETTVHFLIEQ
jgi:hypothetical protein